MGLQCRDAVSRRECIAYEGEAEEGCAKEQRKVAMQTGRFQAAVTSRCGGKGQDIGKRKEANAKNP